MHFKWSIFSYPQNKLVKNVIVIPTVQMRLLALGLPNLYFVVLGLEFRALSMLSKYFAIEPHSQPWFWCY
jgi:hypothetical protein